MRASIARSPSSAPSRPRNATSFRNSSSAEAQAEERKLLAREAKRGLTLLARDWSDSGAAERARSYGPLINAVAAAFEEARRAVRSLQPSGFRVLVPGAGAGRLALAWELACRGFVVEGCEPSFTALLVGNYVMNRMGSAGGADDDDDNGDNGHDDDVETSAEAETAKTKQGRGAGTVVVEQENGKKKIAVDMFPHAHATSNVRSKAAATRAVRVPDVDPKQMGGGDGDFSMRAGSFVDVYDGQDSCWDAVAGYLALDVGEGCVEHVRRVAQILKPGGVWAFVGPAPCVEDAQADAVHISVEEFLGMVRRRRQGPRGRLTKKETTNCERCAER